MQRLFDYDVDIKERLDIFRSVEDKVEVVNSLAFTYISTSCKDVGEYLEAIASMEDQDVYVRFIAATSLVENVNKYIDMSSNGFAIIDRLCDVEECHRAMRRKIILYMCRSGRHIFKTKRRLVHEVTLSKENVKKDIQYVLSIEDEQIPECRKDFFIINVLRHFLHARDMDSVIASERIISRCLTSGKYSDVFESACFHLVDICYNSGSVDLRSDAADVLINSKDDNLISIGRDVIRELSGSDMYHDSKQTVHMTSIELSCVSNLERLLSMQLDVHDYETCVSLFLQESIPSEKLLCALERIEKDRIKHTKYNVTLQFVFCRVWSYIYKSSNRVSLSKRLVEELEDGAGLCSSGFLSRMLNSLSGYDGFGIGVSFEDQIYSYFSINLNNLIKVSPKQDKLLAELSTVTSDGIVGKSLRKFIRNNLQKIRDILSNEFCQYISDVDFDLYFKKAYVRYFD